MGRKQLSGSAYVALLLLVPPATAQPLTLDVWPAWDGFAQPNAITEIKACLTPEKGGEITLRAVTETAEFSWRVNGEAGVPLTRWLPVRLADNHPVAITVSQGATTLLQREFSGFQIRTAALVADVRLGSEQGPFPANAFDPADIYVFQPGVASLPHTSAAYQAVTALILDAAALARLHAPQLEALQNFLADCGRLIVIVPAETAAILKPIAGCEARFLRVISRDDPIAAIVKEVLASHPAALPGLPSLRSLLPEEDFRQPWQRLALFFGGYALSLALLVVTGQRTGLLLMAPLAATGLALAVWSQGAAVHRLVSWAEISTGETAARYAALLQVTGAGRGELPLSIPASLGLPLPVTPDASVTLVQDDRQSGVVSLLLQTLLLDFHGFLLAGAIAVDSPPALYLTATGPAVENRGRSPSPAGLLAWDGNRYSVPVLAPGARWSPAAPPDAWGTTAAEQLLRARSATGVALLIPFILTDASSLAGDLHPSGWLLIRSHHPEARS